MYIELFSGLPLLLGVCLSENPLIMVTQFHGVNGNCITLTRAHKTTLWEDVSDWARVFMETADALQYVHDKGLLHNDIKGDNVVITKVLHFHPVLIDFGKCRTIKDAKLYKLNKEHQKIHLKKYWHIAPELVRGTHKQSYKSDVFSFGVMLKSVCVCMSSKNLKEMAKECMNESPGKRPSLKYVQGKLSELIK
jgi:serine/threonine protein kinase